jgi:hypothetical protein
MNDGETIRPLSLRLMHWLNAALIIGALALGAIIAHNANTL